MTTATGVGVAHNASVEYTTAVLEGMLAEAKARDAAEAPALRIASLRAKVEKQRAHLAGAESALAAEIAAQEAGH
jgi:hypothetical protein